VDLDSKVGRFEEEYLQLGIFLGKGFGITVHKTPISLKKIRENLKSRRPATDLGVSFLLYTILDIIVDGFEEEVRKMEEQVRMVEDEVLERPRHHTLTKIFNNRRSLLLLRKMIRPQRDAISLLVEERHPMIHPGVGLYLRDVLDHTKRTLDTIDTQLDITNASIDIYLSSMSNKMNDIIKMLTMINTVFMPLTLVVGLYAITFPTSYSKWEIGPLFIISVMALMLFIILIVFRKRRWF
jgi:magnesium transporter